MPPIRLSFLIFASLAFVSCHRADMFGYALDPVAPPVLSREPGDFFEPMVDFDCTNTNDRVSLFYTIDGSLPLIELVQDKGFVSANGKTFQAWDSVHFKLDPGKPMVYLRALCVTDYPSIKFSEVVGGLYRIVGSADIAVTVTLPDSSLVDISSPGVQVSYADFITITATAGLSSYEWYLNGIPIPGAVFNTVIVGFGMANMPVFQTISGNLDVGSHTLTLYASDSGFFYTRDFSFKVVP